MKKIAQIALGTLVCLGLNTSSFSMERVFYFLRSKSPDQQAAMQKGLNSLKKHYQSIDAVITQAYQIEADGTVSGYTNPEMIEFAKQHAIKVIILVTNQGFNKEKAHQFLENKESQQKAILALLKICQDNQFYGVQLDFENINIKDKDKLTYFLVTAANAFHKQQLNVSFAVVPTMAEGEQASAYQQKKYDNWGGAYDLRAIGKSADFISIMAYDQHLEGTTPGPYASIRWVEDVIKHAMKYMPTSKISLGVPVYSGYWFTGGNQKRISVRTADVSYQTVLNILKRNHAQLSWNNDDKINYAIYKRAWLNEYLFVEDGPSFKAKIDLTKQYNLRGVSVFNLGNEDERIWSFI